MELSQLLSFVTVVQTKSITNAAMRCNLTKSSVSRHIKSLEEELGVDLFDSSSNEFIPTKEGNVLYKKAIEGLNIIKEIRFDVENMKGHIAGELKIGVGSFIAPYIRRAAVKFMKQYPDVLLKVHFDCAENLNKMLRDGDLDIAFTMNYSYHFENIISKPCIKFLLAAIMSKRNALASKDEVSYDDLMKCRIAMPDVGERVFATFQRYMENDLSKLPVSLIITDASEALLVLDEMDYVTFLPTDYTITSQKLVAKPIKELDMELVSNVHWLKQKPLKPIAKTFIDIVNN